MGWLDATALALRQLRRRPGRALLTVLAVVLAAALLVALLAISETAKTRVLTQLSHGGALAAISVSPNAPNLAQLELDNPSPGRSRPLTATALRAIARLPHVSRVLSVQAVPVYGFPPEHRSHAIRCPRTRPTCDLVDEQGIEALTLLGIDLSDTGIAPVTVLAGHLPARGTPEVDVTRNYLKFVGVPDANPSSVIGTVIPIVGVGFPAPPPGLTVAPLITRWTNLEVVGVVDQQLGSGDLVGWESLAETETAWSAGPPSATPSLRNRDAPFVGAVVVASDLSEVQNVRDAVAAIGYSTAAPEGLIVSVTRYLQVVELVLSGIGITALVIAALGIANALLAAVRERRREIGVLKAIGARDRDVMRVVVVEAGLLGFIGGLAGTAGGMGIAFLIGRQANDYLAAQGLAGVALYFPWTLPVFGALGATVVSVTAGLPAAFRAARLPAREAVET